ncbi:hypothetical protein [Stenotrophomonas sp. 24(2023)]|uniref:hypothetical protein n=1 Tax=Stenotrophomonas sp. 24(2023) TaxID=3068324 RepID=UPI0027DEBF40|nr:hypothetical protein [Stenotrophomonas sp. 24(2023)]WMJ67792.1 hypothetical protein Q9R17_11225 [Stenotrophomonas sp. 24(2023)]
MSVDSASHDDVAGLFKRLGARAGAPQYHDFSVEPASAPPPLTPRQAPQVASVPVVEAVPAPAPVAAAAVPPPPVPVPAMAPAGATALQHLFHRLAQAPLQGPGQSPLARLRQR